MMRPHQIAMALGLFLIAFSSDLYSQEPAVRNVQFTQLADSNVEVTYDLLGDPAKKYEVKLRLAKSGTRGVVRVSREALSGYVGEGISPGRGLRIIWNLPKDYPRGLRGEDFVFIVEVYEQGGGGSKVPWIIGGMAVGGGVAAVILFGSGNGNGNEVLPLPPTLPSSN